LKRGIKEVLVQVRDARHLPKVVISDLTLEILKAVGEVFPESYS
jgi:hypothetical protein